MPKPIKSMTMTKKTAISGAIDALMTWSRSRFGPAVVMVDDRKGLARDQCFDQMSIDWAGIKGRQRRRDNGSHPVTATILRNARDETASATED